MTFKHRLRKLLWKIGIDVVRFNPKSYPLARRKQLLEFYKINVVLDVGANSGQFAKQVRDDIGFSGKIVSFEPLSSAFEMLKKNAAGSPNWEIYNYALGDVEDKKTINISENLYSSSILNILPSHVNAAPESAYIGNEDIQIKSLDSIFHELCNEGDNIYLKIDTQGYESKVIKGAERSIAHIDTIQLEMSIVPLYENELLFNAMYDLLYEKGFKLVSIEPGFSDEKTGQILQVEGVFRRL